VLTGNQGIVIGSLVAGCAFYAGYPITPSSEIMEELSHYLPPRGGVIIQAEDELAAVNMAIGASFGGRKAMTATSGPGFSLMAEGLGLALMAEIPLVVVDVQRVGPSTGIATKTEQSDLWAAIASSHGDNPRVVLAPSSVRDSIGMTVNAFNIAEKYQVPVILLSDQFLAGRAEILDPVPLDAIPVYDRPVAKDLATPQPGAHEGVVPMNLPGLPGGEHTAESTEHDSRGWPDTSHATHQRQSGRRKRKLEALALEEGWVDVCGDPAARVGIIGWGSTAGVVQEAVDATRAQGVSVKGIIPHLLFPPQSRLIHRLFEGLDTLYVPELSVMEQFHHYLRAFYKLPPTVIPIARAGGMPFRTFEVLAAMELKARA
jgi:2-oxoglutarate ferredoxin oxidoreductase subunit alpha